MLNQRPPVDTITGIIITIKQRSVWSLECGILIMSDFHLTCPNMTLAIEWDIKPAL